MFLLIKKILSALIMPLPIGLMLIFIGLLYLYFSTAQRTAGTFISLGFIVLMLFSLNFLPFHLLQHLEQRYQPLTQLPSVNSIVVLGGGVRGNTQLPPNTQLQSASLSRLIEALRLYRLYQRQHQPVKLILSGGRVFGKVTDAGTLENTAKILGVSKQDIVVENGSQDTYQEAVYIKKIVRDQAFILVTSASHMPRAMRLFQHQGMHPIPAPTQFIAQKQNESILNAVPAAKNLVLADVALHEYFGLLWARIQGEV